MNIKRTLRSRARGIPLSLSLELDELSTMGDVFFQSIRRLTGDVRKSMTNGCPSLSDKTELSSVGRVRGSVSSFSEDGGDTGAGLLGKLRLLRFPFNHHRA